MKTIKIKDLIFAFIYLSLALLLVGSSLEKLFHFSVFRMQLKQSPWILISSNSSFWAWTVPIVELVISVLLLSTKTRIRGFIGATFLFTSFLLYMLWIWSMHKNIACGCNAFMEKLNVSQHVWFNMLFVLLSIIGILIHKIKYSKI